MVVRTAARSELLNEEATAMNKKTTTRVRRCSLITGVASLVILVEAAGQVPARPPVGQGEVTGNDVYVRSGESANPYPVGKPIAGARVTTVVERGEWHETKTPAGTLRSIHGDEVATSYG